MVLQDIVVQTTVLDNIVTACRKTLPYAVAFTVEGSLKISLVTSEIIVIDVNETGEGKFKKRAKKKETINRTEDGITPPVPKRKRGRPRKVNYQEPVSESENDGDIVDNDTSGILGSESEIPDIKLETVEGVKEEVAESSDILNQQAELGMQALQSLAMQLSGEGDASSQPIEPSSSDLPATDQPPSGCPKLGERMHGKKQMLWMKHRDNQIIHRLSDQRLEPKEMDLDLGTRSLAETLEEITKNNGNLHKMFKERLDSGGENGEMSTDKQESIEVTDLGDTSKNTSKGDAAETRKTKKVKKVGQGNIVRKTRGGKYMCDICNKVFQMKWALDDHLNDHRGDAPYSCHVCLSGFSDRTLFTMHMNKSHADLEKRFQCDQCVKKFDEAKKLWVHKKFVHRVDRPFVCSVCNKTFKQKITLKKHEELHTEVPGYQCQHCGKPFHTQQALKGHENAHNGRQFKCSICDKAYLQKQNLLDHEMIHTGEMPYQCRFCGKRCIHISTLKRHEMTHTGEKPYKCQFCPKQFARSNVLVIHERTHTGEKPFKCDFCDKAFNKREKKLCHERIHTGVRPYVCPLCGKACTERGNLKKHMKVHFKDDHPNRKTAITEILEKINPVLLKGNSQNQSHGALSETI